MSMDTKTGCSTDTCDATRRCRGNKLIWVLLIVLLNAIISFGYTACTAKDPTTAWAMLSTCYVFFLGITQTGIIFSAIMRIAKSKWGMYFNRLGEALTLSFIPVAFITFIVIYVGGTDHLFYWAAKNQTHGHLSPWLGKGLFLWRNIFFMTAFYVMSYIYFLTARKEEKQEATSYDIKKILNIMACLVMFFFVVTNTNIAWDFGMMIIPHWESTIFPPYYWVSNIFGGVAFLFLMGVHFIHRGGGKHLTENHLESMGIMFMGFVLTWTYMFWSQHIVIWYGDMPELTAPFFKAMTGHYSGLFALMLITIFIIPFFALIFKAVKRCLKSLMVVALLICIGVWLNRYLMIIPVFADGSQPVFASWTGISIIFGSISATLLSIKAFVRFFPEASLYTGPDRNDGGH